MLSLGLRAPDGDLGRGQRRRLECLPGAEPRSARAGWRPWPWAAPAAGAFARRSRPTAVAPLVGAVCGRRRAAVVWRPLHREPEPRMGVCKAASVEGVINGAPRLAIAKETSSPTSF